MLEPILLVLLGLWVISCIFIIFETRVYRIIVYFAIFSLITSLCYLLLGSPDVAMAEAGVSAFVTVFFVICVERYYSRRREIETEKPRVYRKRHWLTKIILPLLFSGGLFALFAMFMPNVDMDFSLRYQYLTRFADEAGGQNAVAAILLYYRVYDTLFEALILVIAVVAVTHMSWTSDLMVPEGRHSEIENSNMAVFTMRIICPLLLVFGAYLIMNGHISAGGGFQGGLAVACFFVARYFIYGIYDLPIKKVIKIEELVFINITVVAVLFVFFGATVYLPYEFQVVYQTIYLIMMNILIGLKVTCSFFLLFYRYVAIERMENTDRFLGRGYSEVRKGRV